mmetsp:Transcript_30433/g.50385  ORF Transcript_30433/g.50385 Transcript_30433/m.50385 type:complete len:240 (-) Transcript_30433:1542-2261(-)
MYPYRRVHSLSRFSRVPSFGRYPLVGGHVVSCGPYTSGIGCPKHFGEQSLHSTMHAARHNGTSFGETDLETIRREAAGRGCRCRSRRRHPRCSRATVGELTECMGSVGNRRVSNGTRAGVDLWKVVEERVDLQILEEVHEERRTEVAKRVVLAIDSRADRLADGALEPVFSKSGAVLGEAEWLVGWQGDVKVRASRHHLVPRRTRSIGLAKGWAVDTRLKRVGQHHFIASPVEAARVAV